MNASYSSAVNFVGYYSCSKWTQMGPFLRLTRNEICTFWYDKLYVLSLSSESYANCIFNAIELQNHMLYSICPTQLIHYTLTKHSSQFIIVEGVSLVKLERVNRKLLIPLIVKDESQWAFLQDGKRHLDRNKSTICIFPAYYSFYAYS